MEKQKASSHQKPLSLTDMSSAFVVLGLGLSLAFLVFLLELIYKRIKDHYFMDHFNLEMKNNRVVVIRQQPQQVVEISDCEDITLPLEGDKLLTRLLHGTYKR